MSEHLFDKHYFHGGGKVGGYAGDGYRDFPVHEITFRHVLARQPKSVLELGAARGYVLKRLEDAGVAVQGLEISEHCRLTRVVEPITTWDITKTPWPIEDNAFDLCLSVAVLEHLPEETLPAVFAEMSRTCARGLHGIDVHDNDGFDQTHCTIRPLAWWKERLPPRHESIDKEELEVGTLAPARSEGVKLNIGSFSTMFPGWRNIDQIDLSSWAAQHGYSFTCWDVRAGLPYDDDVVDLIFSCHLLEHLSYGEGARFLAECRRVLKPGGVIRLLVPDAGALIARYSAGTLHELDQVSGVEPGAGQAARLYEFLCAGHHALYDWPALEHALRAAGFVDAAQARFRHSCSAIMRRETIDLYPDLSLIGEATK